MLEYFARVTLGVVFAFLVTVNTAFVPASHWWKTFLGFFQFSGLPQPIDWGLIGALAATAGSGGIGNLTVTNRVRDSWPERTRPARADQAPRTRPGTVSRASSEVAPWRYTGTPADPAPIFQSWPIPLSAGPPWSGQRPGMARERTRHGSRDRK